MRARRLLILALLALALGVAGCGGDDGGGGKPLPRDTAQQLEAELDTIQRRVNNGSAGACRDILEGNKGPNLERVNRLIDSLPEDVDPDVRSALEQSFDRLWELVQRKCDQLAAAEEQARQEREQEQQPQETDTTPADTTPTDTTPTDTTPTDTTPTTPTTPDEAPLPNDGDGDSGGGIPDTGDGGGAGAGG